MPFHIPRHQHQLSDSESHSRSQSQSHSHYHFGHGHGHEHDNYYSAANAIYSAGQTLSSIGVPNTQWNDPSLNQNPNQIQDHNHIHSPTTAPDNRPYQTHADAIANGNGTVIPYRPGPSTTSSLNASAYSGGQSAGSAESQQQHPGQYQQQSGLRRSLTVGRAGEESHMNQQNQQGTAMSDVHHYGAPPAYGGGEGLSIKIDPSTPQHPNSVASNPVPGTLQPGHPNRPAPLSASNTAPTLPTLPQISTQMQQTPLSARPMLNHTHSYSRSSPGTMDQPKYKPFSNTPEQGKYHSAASAYAPHTPLGPSSYSPLGLADIRPRTDPGLPEIPMSPNVAQENEEGQYPGNSNYIAPWPIYAVDWCKWPPRSNNGSAGKVAIGSYLEDNHNHIQILDTQRTQIDPDNPHGERGLEFVKTAEATHAYPVTRILWEPPSSNKQTTDLLATSGDHLRLWSLPNEQHAYSSNSITRPANNKSPPLAKLSPLALLSNSKSPEHTAPITSLDWNVVQPSLIITSSIDTTCTIWDIPTLTAKTQLIAHDKEVYDVRFCANSVDVFVSCGADGSVRMFDLRSLEHSTIIYEPSEKQQDKSSQLEALSTSPTRTSGSSAVQTLPFPPPLLRIAASPHDAHLLATFSQDSNIIRVLDVRQPGQALLELKGHAAPVNCIGWSNTQRGVLASGADDCCVLLWDLMASTGNLPTPGGSGSTPSGPGGSAQERGPSAVWECDYEVSNLSWAPTPGTLGVCGGKGFWGVQL
ncbi:hypothetical protein HRR83_003335 [Exophiala dermatitidis]|uniref:WD repeat protein n=2 Tax=Exophiala dermatitidis TaxID=5970 RepID=H6BMS1_EXODN|nr:uncharacterized protein HMPREF1120_00317 [Exophiala dermatitidis NIH/UT8656]KAJ4514757.1 hypothetical protein HRR75_004121 [Exophiala dermatitidis]EHY52098.1 hypothetical protein HMPREF1120_00317 [Exophiala dermatitidis NIH/UT8656]KAJ4518212.1 hypothetical protein HRR74_004507 [Exophiala dermatitidis]KAJ4521110.1 hypothetical protein HRR73_003451 [Exophiala dermatitidis]KAJ4547693.1 hypothetical protein HRR76_000325 [Exophiala dermatitidis]